MDNTFILEILDQEGMINIEQGMNIYHLLTQTLLQNIEGDVVELGCHKGAVAAIIQKTLEENNSNKKLFLYDSFKGLPEKNEKDGNTRFQEGWCKTDESKVYDFFKKNEIKKPKIFSGWFKDTLPKKLPKKISFAHLDGDFYSSIKESLENIYPKLSKGAVVVIDDYYNNKIHKEIEKLINKNKYSKKSGRKIKIDCILPGVKKACDRFFKNKKESLNLLISEEERHVYFRKK